MDIRVATKDLLNRPTALLNKNTLATDNNIFITRSNIIFTQNDRLAMRKKVEDVLKMKTTTIPRHEQSDTGMTTHATMAKNVMRAVSAPDTDTALMTKASAVVAAQGDAAALAQRIADFVDAAGKREMDHEQAIQSQTPRGVMVLVGTKDILRQPTGVVNKNFVMSDDQVAITRSHIMPTQNDQIVVAGGAKVADAILPAAAVDIGKVATTEATGMEPMYRQAFVYPKDGEADAAMASTKKEQWGLWGGGCGGGWGCGWRYPIGYWNAYGAGLYGGGGCGLGLGLGGFYYC